MADPGWAAREPGVNDMLIKSGAGPGTTLANMAVWIAESIAQEVAFGTSLANAGMLSAQWLGAGATGSATSGTGLNSALQVLTGWVLAKIPITETAATAYATAVAGMIPQVECHANRIEEHTNQQINPWVFGALTPVITALNTTYFGGYWPNNSSVGIAYGTVLSGLTAALGVPAPPAPMGASPAAPAAAATAVAEATATNTAGQAMRESSEAAATAANQGTSTASDMGSQMSSIMQPMQSMAQMVPQMMQAPMQAMTAPMQALTSPIQSLMGMFTSMKPTDGLATSALTDPLKGGPGATPLASTGGPGAGTGVGAGVGGVPTAAPATSYTRPTSSFATEGTVGRANGVQAAGLLESPAARTTTGMGGGSPMPMHPGMLGNRGGEDSKEELTHARIVVDTNPALQR